MTAKPKDQIIDIFTVEPALDQEVSGTASLDELESVIARNIRSFYKVGIALTAIKRRKLYQEHGYKTFEDYINDRWDISRAHAYRSIKCSVVIENLSPIGDKVPLPENESQARPLTRLSEHLQKKLGEGCKNSTKRENHGRTCAENCKGGTRPARR